MKTRKSLTDTPLAPLKRGINTPPTPSGEGSIKVPSWEGIQGWVTLLIHGDNLLALKALEQDFAGKINCACIDQTYNTGNAFEHYDDGL